METADVIVIGGGVLGAAVAYHLAKRAVRHVVVLERNSVGQGNSSLAAGLLTRGRFKPGLIPMVLETYQSINEIEVGTGSKLGMRQVGCLYVAVSAEHRNEIQLLADISSRAGLKVNWLDSHSAERLVPWLNLPPASSIIFMPEDGYIDGYSLAHGYIQAAKSMGVEVRESTQVLSICLEGQHITGVITSQGRLSASLVIDAAGVWAGILARRADISLPMAPVRSHYWVTADSEAISPDQPFVILPDARAYARPELSRLLFGFREAQSVAVNPLDLPEQMLGYTFKQDPDGWETLLEGIPELEVYLPILMEIELTRYIRGLSNYTPDGNFVLGACPPLDGFLAATGCSGAGIAMSGGIGRLIAELATGQAPFVDPLPHRLDRFGAIDPLERSFLERCAQARSGKITG
jgi:sarcosine oxidase, subunit beta